jgi:endonuclease/exonuclease/phosphatase family metal-dependent hydrolase
MKAASRIRVVTYNIHKSRGLDGKTSPARIVKVLRELDADIIALQEVVWVEGGAAELDQGRFFADALSYHYCPGATRRTRGVTHGNVVLSRVPIRSMCNYDLTWHRRERRACLRVDIEFPHGHLLHVFNVHLGLAFGERRHQARKLVGADMLANSMLKGTRLVLGDFNDWTRGFPSRLLATHLESVDIQSHLGHRRTYPGVLPLQLEQLVLHRSRTALIASDHIPLAAEFSFI